MSILDYFSVDSTPKKSNPYSIENIMNPTVEPKPNSSVQVKRYKKSNPYSIENILNPTVEPKPNSSVKVKRYDNSNPYSIENILNPTVEPKPNSSVKVKKIKKSNPYSIDNMLNASSIDTLLNNSNDKVQIKKIKNSSQKVKSKSGMNELSRVLLGMNRDIKFSKKASTPNGAAEMVAKHNSTKAKKWHLNLINPNGPIDANNFTDINGDGIPDILILNEKNSPVYINGFTTKISNSMKKRDQIESSNGNSAYSKFKKKVFSAKNTALTEMGLNNADKLQQMGLLNKAMSEIWQNEIIQKVYDKLNLTTQKDINKAKKTPAYKNELMATVDENIAQHRDDRTYYHSLLTHAMVDVQNNRTQTPTENNSKSVKTTNNSNPYDIPIINPITPHIVNHSDSLNNGFPIINPITPHYV